MMPGHPQTIEFVGVAGVGTVGFCEEMGGAVVAGGGKVGQAGIVVVFGDFFLLGQAFANFFFGLFYCLQEIAFGLVELGVAHVGGFGLVGVVEGGEALGVQVAAGA